MFDKKYEVYLDGHIPCGEFEGVRSFVEDYSYEDSVQFYIDDIKTRAAPVLDGFEWGGHYFKEIK